MSDEIPEDVMKAAEAVYESASHPCPPSTAVEAIARAILAERNRCLGIIEGHDILNGDMDGPLEAIAKAIRSPHE